MFPKKRNMEASPALTSYVCKDLWVGRDHMSSQYFTFAVLCTRKNDLCQNLPNGMECLVSSFLSEGVLAGCLHTHDPMLLKDVKHSLQARAYWKPSIVAVMLSGDGALFQDP